MIIQMIFVLPIIIFLILLKIPVHTREILPIYILNGISWVLLLLIIIIIIIILKVPVLIEEKFFIGAKKHVIVLDFMKINFP